MHACMHARARGPHSITISNLEYCRTATFPSLAAAELGADFPFTLIPCSIVLHFGVGARPLRDMPLYSKGRSTSVATRGRLA
jgi:hypothetical protein